jgi:hypothetical protein
MAEKSTPEPVARTSPDLKTESIERLKELFPQVVTEGRHT